MLFLVIAGKDGRDGVNGDVHYFIKIILLVIKVAECGQQRLNVKMLSLRSSAVLCVVVKIYVITSDILGPNACAQSVFCAFHTFFVEVQTNGYIHAMHG